MCGWLAGRCASIIFHTLTRVRIAWVGWMPYFTRGTKTMFWKELEIVLEDEVIETSNPWIPFWTPP